MIDTTNTNDSTALGANPKAVPSLAELDMRDYFAAKALQGYMANPTSFGPDVPDDAKHNPAMVANICAAFAYLIADAMLKARGGQ